MIRILLVAMLVCGAACERHVYQLKTMPGAANLGDLVPFVWADSVVYDVVCNDDFLLCSKGHLGRGINDALKALGHGWDVSEGAAGTDTRTLYLRFEASHRRRSDVRLGFTIAMMVPTLGMVPYVNSTEITFHVTARRGDKELMTRASVGGANVTDVGTLNPVVILATSSKRTVARALAADVVVATMYQLTRSAK